MEEISKYPKTGKKGFSIVYTKKRGRNKENVGEEIMELWNFMAKIFTLDSHSWNVQVWLETYREKLNKLLKK